MHSNEYRAARLERPALVAGFSVDEVVVAATLDNVSPAIRINPDCGYTVGIEPGQDRGWCECRNKSTLQSAFVLAGLE